jgi:sugar/nucleoside kinase (ribokinase family)
MSGRLMQLSGVIVDHVYRVEAVPRAGQEARVLSSYMAAGGGFNAMVAARRFGMEVIYAGGLGSGPFADIASQAMRAEGIDPLRPPMAGKDQGCCTTLIDADGERTFIASEGADGRALDADLALVKPRLNDWLLLSGYALGYLNSRDALHHWLAAARGLQLVFDPSPLVNAIPEPILAAARQAALWISANAAEARFMTGGADPAQAAEVLASDRPQRGGALVRSPTGQCGSRHFHHKRRAVHGPDARNGSREDGGTKERHPTTEDMIHEDAASCDGADAKRLGRACR